MTDDTWAADSVISKSQIIKYFKTKPTHTGYIMT